MYHSIPDFHAMERRYRAWDRQDEDRRNRRKDGSEPLRAKPVPPRAKALFALVALVINGGLAVLAWNAGFTAIAVLLGLVAALMAVDLGWQRYKMSRQQPHDEPTP